MTHSIPDTVCIVVHTPHRKVAYMNDFKLDAHPDARARLGAGMSGTARPSGDGRDVLLLVHPFFPEWSPWSEITDRYLEYCANLEARLRTFRGRLVTLEESHNIPATLLRYGKIGVEESGKVFSTYPCDPTPLEPSTWRDVTSYLHRTGSTVLVGGGYYREFVDKHTRTTKVTGCCGDTVKQLRGADIPHVVVPGLTF